MKELLKTVQVAVRLSLQNWRLHLKLKSFASSRTHHLMDKGYSQQRDDYRQANVKSSNIN